VNRVIKTSLLAVLVAALLASTAVAGVVRPKPEKWRALHVLDYASDADLDALAQSLPKLAQMGINVLILEVDYDFEFKSHPELRRGKNPITRAGARRFAQTCRKNNIRLIPEFQSLGHQSWKAQTFPLLTAYPKFDLTPGAFPNNEGLYCREWNPLDPDLNAIVFALIDEIIDAFQADALHAGMDEVFLLGSDSSPSTKGKDPAKLFAKAVNDLHDHLKKRRVEMLIWGDRLFDGKDLEFGEWESSLNGTAAAIDQIPRDIILCPWHYEKKDAYPSIPMFIKKGFRVLPAGWNKVDATQALIEYAERQNSSQVIGHLFTTWGVKKDKLIENEPLSEGLKVLMSRKSSR
jgi:glycosyl hydrolase family 20